MSSAQFLILDIGYPMSDETKENIIYSVKNVINLAALLTGKPRIPAFGMSTLDLSYTKLLSVSLIKGNLEAILNCFDLLLEKNVNNAKTTLNHYCDLILQAVQDIISDFSTKSEDIKSEKKIWSSWPSQIQITLVTGKKASPITEIFVDIVKSNKNISLKLKQIDIVAIQLGKSVESLSVLNCRSNFINSIVEPDSCINLDSVFKKWLLQGSSYKEHLQIILNEDSVIKCDINDVLINADTLPFGHRFKLGNNQNLNRVSSLSSVKGSNEVPIYELQVTKRINLSSDKAPYLFDSPQRLLPTQCWDLTLNELTLNKQLFKSLCKNMKASNTALVAELQYENSMTAYFFIVQDGVSLLLNSIAPMELQLPSLSESSVEVSKEIEMLIQKSLEKFPMLEKYSPSDFQSNFYQCLEERKSKQVPPELSDSFEKKSPYLPKTRSKRRSNETRSIEDLVLDKPGEYVPECLPTKKIKTPREKSEFKKTDIKEYLHPAFLPTNLKNKFRKKSFFKEISELDLDLGDAEELL